MSMERRNGAATQTNVRSLPNLKKVKAPFTLPYWTTSISIVLLYFTIVAESFRRDFNDDVPQFVHLCNKQNVKYSFLFFFFLYFLFLS